MDDRKLLELAAKAAGYDINFNEPVNDWYPHGYDSDGNVAKWWNPIKCDGDALRLAVTLEMAVTVYCVCTDAQAYGKGSIRETDGTDNYATTRRAIVRAAAAIGEQMP